VHGYGHGLCKRTTIGGDAALRTIDADSSRYGAVLRKTTVTLQANGPVPLAQVRLTAPAPTALPAIRAGATRDNVPAPETVDASPDCVHNPSDLVPGNKRSDVPGNLTSRADGKHLGASLVLRGVGSADTCGVYLKDQLSIGYGRRRNLTYSQISDAVHD
jgi:hypothetical protein